MGCPAPSLDAVKSCLAPSEPVRENMRNKRSLAHPLYFIRYSGLLSKMGERVENWTDKAIEIYSRHRSMEGKRFPQHDVMASLNETVSLINKYMILITLVNIINKFML